MRRVSAPRRNAAPMLAEQSDGELLSRVIATNDEAAFEALVERHEQMVEGRCWHLLNHQQDAEDAALQTFIVLWRKAASIHNSEALPSWLNGVARRVARNIRKIRERREIHECLYELAQLAQLSDSGGDAETQETMAVIAREVQDLPEKYRLPFLLHCVEGKTRKETAVDLGMKEGTVATRTRRARELLQEKLTQFGITH